jgi:Xanthosine triphosphate pyrophosphatase
MEKLVFATNNSHKLHEIKEMLDNSFELLSLNEIGCSDDIPETGETLEANASQKSFYIWDRFHFDCFADDTGLEIEALNNEPGVYSARYAGDAKCAEANVAKVLEKMQDLKNRKARFRCVISLIISGEEMQFEGIVNGKNYL